MASDCKVVSYRPDLKAQVIELQKHLWSPSADLNSAYFDWKYLRNPYLQQPLIYLSMCDGQAIGMRSFFGVCWEAGNPPTRHPALYADDAVIAPAYRNRGLMPQIMKAALEDLAQRGYDFAFNLSASPITLLASLSAGWRSAGWVAPMRRQPWLKFPVRGSAMRSQTLADIGAARVQRVLDAHRAVSLQEHPRCADMAELVLRLGSGDRIRHVRDCPYFEWRFQNPLSRYRFLFHDTDCLQGYLVLQEYTSEFADRAIVNIVDWEATSEGPQRDLLLAALKLVRARSIVIWSVSLNADTLKLLEQSRFRLEQGLPGDFRQCPAILVRAIGDGEQGEGNLDRRAASDWQLGARPLTQRASWDLRMLYSMHG
jgi:GNAT superfamily N-acetyltransferase